VKQKTGIRRRREIRYCFRERILLTRWRVRAATGPDDGVAQHPSGGHRCNPRTKAFVEAIHSENRFWLPRVYYSVVLI